MFVSIILHLQLTNIYVFSLFQLVESINGDECARESKLGFLIEKSRATLLLHRFFQEGKVATQSSLQPCNDNEYIGETLFFAILLL